MSAMPWSVEGQLADAPPQPRRRREVWVRYAPPPQEIIAAVRALDEKGVQVPAIARLVGLSWTAVRRVLEGA